jgi:biotin transport system ATP-binding protein
MTSVALNGITKRFKVDEETASGLPALCETDRTRGGFFYALEDVSLVIAQGEFCVIAGANGSGKSLLMGVIAGLDSPTRGTCVTEGRAGLVFQDADSQLIGETPLEDAAFGPKNLGFGKKESSTRARDSLEAVGLLAKADFAARNLSGGEKRRLSLAGVLAMDCPLVIFDEPYANLDYDGVKSVNAALMALKQQQKTVIVLTHELEKCLALADRFFVLYNGRLKFDGTPQEMLRKDNARALLESWGIRHPFCRLEKTGDLLWL